MKKPAMMRRALAVLGATTLVAGLAACGQAATPEESGGPTTIQWWGWDPGKDGAPPIIEAFEADHPDIKVQYKFIGYSDYANTLRLAVSSAGGPDIFGLEDGAMAQQFGELSTDLAPYAQESHGADYTDQFIGASNLVIDDRQAAMPYTYTAAGEIWYNKTLFDTLGISGPPADLADWKADCEILRAAGYECFVQGAKDGWVNVDVFQAIANQFSPGELTEALQGKTDIDTDTFRDAFQVWKTLFDDGYFQAGALAATEYPDANDLFHGGKAGMIALGTFNNSKVNKKVTEALATTYGNPALATTQFMPAPFPAVTDNAKTGTLFGSSFGWAISEASEKKDAAWVFVNWLTSEGGQNFPASTTQQPAFKEVSPSFDDVLTPEQADAIKSFSAALADPAGRRTIENADVQTALWDALSSVAAGLQTPAEATAALQQAIDAAYQ